MRQPRLQLQCFVRPAGRVLLSSAINSGRGKTGRSSQLLHSLRGGTVPSSGVVRSLVFIGLRGFRTSAPRPTFYWFLTAKVAAAVVGRYAGRWWRRQPQPIRESLRAHWGLAALGGAWLSLAFGVYYHSHVQETPLTRRRRFLVLTPQQMDMITETETRKELWELGSQGRLASEDDPRYRRLVAVTCRLANAARHLVEGSRRAWTVVLVTDSNINACVYENGYIFVNTGLLDFVGSSDDQLAAVLGHEIAHVLLSHPLEKLSFIRLMDWLIIVSMAAIWTVIPKDGIAVVTQWFYRKVTKIVLEMPYSRKLEREADKVGMMLAAKACFDVRWQGVYWARLRLAALRTRGREESEWLSTHPLHSRREADFHFHVSKVLATMCTDCGPLPARDPMETIKVEEARVSNYLAALKARQNLRRVPKEKTGKLAQHIEVAEARPMTTVLTQRKDCECSIQRPDESSTFSRIVRDAGSKTCEVMASGENAATITDRWLPVAVFVTVCSRIGKKLGLP